MHWDTFNKRLDEWIPGSRLILSKDLEWPQPKAPPVKKSASVHRLPGKAPRPQNLLKKATSNAALAASPGKASIPDISFPPSPSPAPSFKRKYFEEDEQPDDSDADADGDMDVDAEGDVETFDLSMADSIDETQTPAEPVFSKEQEIEKLRTSGSMTQSISEIARVKNLNRLQIGKHEVDAWYFSPYPKEYAHLPILYICEFCLSFFPSLMMISRHRKRCTMLHPPGNEIYRHEDLSFYEIDGKHQLTWCRNLSLLSKCFLDQWVASSPTLGGD